MLSFCSDAAVVLADLHGSSLLSLAWVCHFFSQKAACGVSLLAAPHMVVSDVGRGCLVLRTCAALADRLPALPVSGWCCLGAEQLSLEEPHGVWGTEL